MRSISKRSLRHFLVVVVVVVVLVVVVGQLPVQ